jgi:hypothetical protein
MVALDMTMPDTPATFLLIPLLCASAAVGYFIKTRLPERHRSRDSFELVQISITLLVNFTAIVLGLLTNSVKSGFDTAYSERGAYAAAFVQMDRCLRDYGPGTDPLRADLQAYVAAVIASTWPDETPPEGVRFPSVAGIPLTGESPKLGSILDTVGTGIRRLEPTDPVHERIETACLQQYAALQRTRWQVIEQRRASISPPFYWVLVFWLVILFASIGLTAPGSPVTVIVVILSALSITAAMLVIQDMDRPYGGVFGIPSTSMRAALSDMTAP